MRFGILGPLLVTDGDREVVITAGRDRVVLAMLLLHANRTVGIDSLVDAVWQADPPATARGQLQTCVSRLRRLLPVGAIRTDPAGYRIVVSTEDLDAALLSDLLTRARAAQAQPERAAKLFHEALALWRGVPLAGLESPAVRRFAAVLEEQRGAAAEDRADLELAQGHERELVVELTALVEAYPLRERLRMQLMRTLHRLGRQADALAEYRRAYELFRQELGIQPGAHLQALHRHILADTGTPMPSDDPATTAVHSLPRTVGDFTGRADAVARLLRAAAETNVLAIDGMAGSGKTTLALRVARLLASSYPDAQLFVDLQGHSAREPIEAGAALLHLLRQLHVDASRIPPDLDGRVALWRSKLTGRRVLVILDNAACSAQVGLLLPAAETTLTVVTSRRRLAGLDGGHPESLPVMDEPEAIALLQRIVGKRVSAEREAALEVVRRCGCLPLAIRLAGARLAHRPRWAVADLVRRLSEATLPELAAEDRTVAGAFALSYEQLPIGAQRLFRMVGLHPAEHFDAVAVAALTGLPLPDTRDVLDHLVDVNLVEEPTPDRFRLHDLVREYAIQLASSIAPDDRRVALCGLINLHLYASAQINLTVEIHVVDDEYPRGAGERPDLIASAVADPFWLENQRPALVPLIRAAAEIGALTDGWLLARVNWRFLYNRGYAEDLIQAQELGIDLAERAGNKRGAAKLSNFLASGYFRQGRYAEALGRLAVALDHAIQSANLLDEGRVRNNMAGIYQRTGQLHQALDQASRAYEITRRYRYPNVNRSNASLAGSNVSLASAELALGRPVQALRRARLALQSAVEVRIAALLTACLVTVAEVRLHLGDVYAAQRLLASAHRMADNGGFIASQFDVLHLRGVAELQEGRPDQAVRFNQAALSLAREHSQIMGVAQAENALGAAHLALDDIDGAAESFRQALDQAGHIGAELEVARALHGLGACAAARDDAELAARLRRQALEIHTRLGVPAQDHLHPVPDGGRMEG